MALAANALTTITEMESVLGLASGSADTKLTRVINQASAIAELYCGRVFYRDTAIVEKHTGKIGPILVVDRPILNSITSVKYLDGDAETSSNYEISDADAGEIYRVSGSWSGIEQTFRDASGTNFAGQGRKVWTITYDGGWYTPQQVLDDGTLTRGLPYDLEHAAIQIATHMYKSEGRDGLIESESLMEASVKYGTIDGGSAESASAWLRSAAPGAAAILNRYRLNLVF